MTTKLLDYRHDRKPLMEGLHQISSLTKLPDYTDRFSDGSTGPLEDICPFTAMCSFNQKMTDTNRKGIANELASFLEVDIEKDRKEQDIDVLWEAFSAAAAYAASGLSEDRTTLEEAFDDALAVKMVGWNLTFGLFWGYPWSYPPLDQNSSEYMDTILGLRNEIGTAKKPYASTRYFELQTE